jgi:phage regulator Rha-like protein
MTPVSSKKKRGLVASGRVEPVIREVRRKRVILAADLAQVYGVTAKRLNEQVKRNIERFPDDFMFQLTHEETQSLQGSRSQVATLKRGQNLKYLPYAFTEHGAVMAANVLRSKRAIAMSVYVVRAFLKLREVMANTEELAWKLNELERKLATRQDLHEKAILQLFAQMRELLVPRPLSPPPNRRRIGF